MDSVTLTRLINWETENIHEPIFTCTLSKKELLEIYSAPFTVPYYPHHTQSVERVVKEVTQAADSVCGFDKRDGFIKARVANREVIPKFQSKKDLNILFKI